MKTALILGTNAGQADIIGYLRESGWFVHACGYKRVGPGCDLADKFHLVDILDVEAVKTLARDIKADIVYSVSSDLAIKTVTKVSEDLGLPVLLSSEVIDLFDKKDRLREYLNKKNIAPVKYLKMSSLDCLKEWDAFPCVVKPVDSQGQRGLRLITKRSDLEGAVQKAMEISKSGSAIIEEFLEGVEVSSNVIVQSGKIIVNEVTERLVHGPKFFGLPKGHVIPARSVGEDVVKASKKIVEDIVKCLSIKDAVLYIQMKVDSKGPKVIEVAPRLDGCHIWRLIKIARGYDLRKYAIKLLIGEKIDHYPVKSNKPYGLHFMHMPPGKGFQVGDFSVPKNALYSEYRYSSGEEVEPINGSFEVVGYYVISEGA